MKLKTLQTTVNRFYPFISKNPKVIEKKRKTD